MRKKKQPDSLFDAVLTLDTKPIRRLILLSMVRHADPVTRTVCAPIADLAAAIDYSSSHFRRHLPGMVSDGYLVRLAPSRGRKPSTYGFSFGDDLPLFPIDYTQPAHIDERVQPAHNGGGLTRSQVEQVEPPPKNPLGNTDIYIPREGMFFPPSEEQTTLWQAAYSQLEIQLDRHNFDTWVRGSALVGIQDGAFVVGARNEYARDMLQHRLYRNVRRILSDCNGDAVEVRFDILSPKPPPGENHNGDDPAANRNAITPEKIAAARRQYPPAWVDEAVTIARQKSKSWNYVRGTLNNMAKERVP